MTRGDDGTDRDDTGDAADRARAARARAAKRSGLRYRIVLGTTAGETASAVPADGRSTDALEPSDPLISAKVTPPASSPIDESAEHEPGGAVWLAANRGFERPFVAASFALALVCAVLWWLERG